MSYSAEAELPLGETGLYLAVHRQVKRAARGDNTALAAALQTIKVFSARFGPGSYVPQEFDRSVELSFPRCHQARVQVLIQIAGLSGYCEFFIDWLPLFHGEQLKKNKEQLKYFQEHLTFLQCEIRKQGWIYPKAPCRFERMRNQNRGNV